MRGAWNAPVSLPATTRPWLRPSGHHHIYHSIVLHIMSLLPPEAHERLTRLLQALSSSDNNVRSQGEDELNNDWLQARPDVLLMGLVEQIEGATEPSVRPLSFLRGPARPLPPPPPPPPPQPKEMVFFSCFGTE